jgi:nicotinate phosphoribosyltransferase
MSSTVDASLSLALHTDLYQLTMAHGYWKLGRHEDEAVFHVTFRSAPFDGAYAIAAGLGPVADLIENYHFTESDIAYLGELRGSQGQPVFDDGFLQYLSELRLTVDIDAVPEGTAVFPFAPVLRVRGPLLHGQLLETALLNILNFQTLIATKAARVCSAAGDDPVLEFGLRRAHGINGGLSASRAAYIGGCAATSNVLAGKHFGIPVRGTHAHAWVMVFDGELQAFDAWADAMPDHCVFLVDTYDTLEGVRHAIEVGRRLRERGSQLAGIRLDSGDLAYLSIEARKLLDDGGFPDAVIVASNDLDEHLITSLKGQGAQISVWGVGTRLSTAFDQPALGGIYKLSALRSPGGEWQPKIKLSEQVIKTSVPGQLQVMRYEDDDGFVADCIIDELNPAPDGPEMIVDPIDPTRRRRLEGNAHPLLQPIFRDGKRVAPAEHIDESRKRTGEQLSKLHPTIRRIVNPHGYPCGLELGLHERRMAQILEAKGHV